MISMIRIAFLALWVLPAWTARAQQRTGQVIYSELCASCHGDKGQGVAGKYDEPLYGEKSVEALARYIDRTMPDEKPELCVGEDAKQVAQYIFDNYYSTAARARLHPARRELQHLTNRQYVESVADLLGSFLEPREPGAGTGLKAQYFQSDGMNKKAGHKLDREDKRLDFDFGEGEPVPGCSAEQFSIAWQGSLLAAETGVYEFRISTPNGARLYLNGDVRAGDQNQRDDTDARRQSALIDAWVSSGPEVRQATAKIALLGGRSYPLRLDYFKFKEKRGMVKLEWKPPHGTWGVLETPFISPAKANHVSVVTTTFPPDDGSLGYERGAAVSREWYEATTRAAIEIGNEIQERLGMLINARDDVPDRAARVKEFGYQFAARAFRQELKADEKAFYVDRHFVEGMALETSIKRVAMLVLKSPRFLYPLHGQVEDQWALAARLALYLWDSLPDNALREAAAKGELKSPEQVREQARRMMARPQARARLKEFFHDWLSFEEADDNNKDHGAYPDFDDAIVSDLRASLDAFVDHIIWEDASDYRKLLVSSDIWVNARLAKFLGVGAPAGEGFQPVAFDPGQRAGVFTHPFLLAAFSYHKSSSPIHRGVFLTRNILGRFLKPPPMAIVFMDDKFEPSLTMREKVTELTRSDTCMACHSTINPLGFSLENYDAVGRWRTQENNKPVNAESDYLSADGDVVRLRGPRDIAEHAASSAAARRGFVRRLFQYAIKQQPAAYGPDTLQMLDDGFTKGGYHVRNLMVEIAIRAALPE